MKIKRIAAICKPWKRVELISIRIDTREIAAQYIKAGAAIYPVRGLPFMDAEQLLTVFDIPLDKRGDWHAEEFRPDPDRYNLENMAEGEKPVEMIPISLEGMILQGILFPQEVLTEKFMEIFRTLYHGTEESYERTLERDALRLEETRRNLEFSEMDVEGE